MTSPQTSHRSFLIATIIAAATAAAASSASHALSLPVWAMFIGWIAFFTRGLNARSAFENLGCVGLGMMLGALAAIGIQSLVPAVGLSVAVPTIVFLIALLVVSLRGLAVLNNLLGYFLGLVAWFAAHLEPSLEGVGQLLGASALGTAAGLISHQLPVRLAGRAHRDSAA